MDQLFADQEVTIEDLYPDLTPEERAEAQRQLLAYLGVVWQIYKRKEGIADKENLPSHFSNHHNLLLKDWFV